MALSINELKKRAKEYVEMEIPARVLSVRFERQFTLFGETDVVLSVHTTNKKMPDWWVIAGSTPMNLYLKKRFVTADEAFSMHTGLMMRMQDHDFKSREKPPKGIGYDAFLCHASEDKETIVRPLAKWLKTKGFWVWYDEFSLTVGDSLRRSIDKGLRNSRYGIIILSKSFFKKKWPQYEMDGLTAREVSGKKVILPVWHDVDKKDVLRYSPPLADKVSIITKGRNIDEIGRELGKAMAN